MIISAKCEYACRALLELALRWPRKDTLHIIDISHRQDIPMKYLVQILILLKRAGLVESVRGKKGGYRLKRDPKAIILRDVLEIINGPILSKSNMSKLAQSPLSFFWDEAKNTLVKYFESITFETIVDKVEQQAGAIFYQI